MLQFDAQTYTNTHTHAQVEAAADILARSLSLASPRGPPTRQGQGPLRVTIPVGQGVYGGGCSSAGAVATTTPSPRYGDGGGGGRRAASVPGSPSANGARAAKKAPVRWCVRRRPTTSPALTECTSSRTH